MTKRIFINLYSWLLSRPLVWCIVNLFDRVRVEKHSQIVGEIKEHGIYVTSLKEFFSDEHKSIMYEIQHKYRPEDLLRGHKDHLRYWLGDVAHQQSSILERSDPLSKLATSRKLIEVVEEYLGKRCDLKHIEFTRTLPHADDPIYSQRWHRDPGIECCIKVFLYLSDVGGDQGPFCYFPGTHKRGALADYCKNDKWYGGGFYPSHESLEKLIESGADPQICLGKSGTLVLCDTTGLHMGGLCQVGYRDMATFVFYPKYDPVRKRLTIVD
jgi:hypothetical protein